jgi:hypothetical protein
LAEAIPIDPGRAPRDCEAASAAPLPFVSPVAGNFISTNGLGFAMTDPDANRFATDDCVVIVCYGAMVARGPPIDISLQRSIALTTKYLTG